MCLILVAWQVHSHFPLVIAANRDEFFSRPAAGASWWPDAPDILAGRDLRARGTWLGMTRTGRFAALTNYRGAAPRFDAPSRGTLVTDILKSTESVSETLQRLQDRAQHYCAFNVIFSDGQRLGVYESESRSGRELPAGMYGLSNHLLDTPWPKVVRAKSVLAAALSELPDTGAALEMLRDDQAAPDHLLPLTGVSQDWERMLSSAFIRGGNYGTRCSTIVLADRHGEVAFDEWTWGRFGEQVAHQRWLFRM